MAAISPSAFSPLPGPHSHPFAKLEPLDASRALLGGLGVRLSVQFRERIPSSAPLLVVSNHRSFMDAPLVMTAIERPMRFACHYYMSQVPGMRELVQALGCIPLEKSGQQRTFFRRANRLLQDQQTVGIFPEGAAPMVERTDARQMYEFHRGFAHLALRASVKNLTILPVAIASSREVSLSALPLQVLSWFDPSEPLFDQPGWHPAVIYRRVDVLVGRPVIITDRLRSQYRGQGGRHLATEITQCCQNEIELLLRRWS